MWRGDAHLHRISTHVQLMGRRKEDKICKFIRPWFRPRFDWSIELAGRIDANQKGKMKGFFFFFFSFSFSTPSTPSTLSTPSPPAPSLGLIGYSKRIINGGNIADFLLSLHPPPPPLHSPCPSHSSPSPRLKDQSGRRRWRKGGREGGLMLFCRWGYKEGKG